MKKINLVLILFTGLVLSSCGREAEEDAGRAFQLQLILPQSLPKTGTRFRALRARSEYLVIKVTSAGGVDYENRFAPASWDSLSIPDLGFPQSEKDSLKIKVEIWDRKLDGVRRSFPVMEGSVSKTAADLAGDTRIPVKLSLKVSPESYD